MIRVFFVEMIGKNLYFHFCWNSLEIMLFFSNKQSGKVQITLQKCHSNLQNALKFSARFHFLVQIYTIFCAGTYIYIFKRLVV